MLARRPSAPFAYFPLWIEIRSTMSFCALTWASEAPGYAFEIVIQSRRR